MKGFPNLPELDKRRDAGKLHTTRTDQIRRVAGLDGSEARFSLYGEFDIYNEVRLSATVEPYVAFQTLVFDLALVTFIDASILGVFVRIAGRRRALNAKRLRLVNAKDHFRRIFSLCNLDDTFDVGDEPKAQPPSVSARAVTALP